MDDRVAWVGSPNNRGTMDIFWSCITTLTLCVWTAVHPNIQLRPSTSRNLLVRILMMLTAIVFPEILISAALRQRSLASAKKASLRRKIDRGDSDQDVGWVSEQESRQDSHQEFPAVRYTGRMTVDSPRASLNELTQRRGTAEASGNMVEQLSRAAAATAAAAVAARAARVLAQAESLSNEKDPLYEDGDSVSSAEHATLPLLSKWKREQLYFVVMGGLTVEFDDRRYFLTVHALPFMERAGCLPKLTMEDVEERSNADVITKLIVVMQTVWFAVQIVARLASHLAVTALEVHTIVHVGCAMAMYALWWDKPYNVSRSIEVRDPKAKEVAALFVYKRKLDERYDSEFKRFEEADREYWSRTVRQAHRDYVEAPEAPARHSVGELIGANQHADAAGNTRVKAHGDGDITSHARNGLAALLEVDSNAIALLDERFDGVRTSSDNFTALSVWGSWTVDHGHEWSFDKLMHILFNLLYGAGHLAAWSSTAFPTYVERWLWRLSALMLVSVVVWGALWILFWQVSRSRHLFLRPVQSGELNFLVGPLFCLVMLAFVLARGYFLVEALVSLRSLPPSAYDLVQWTYFLPHAS